MFHKPEATVEADAVLSFPDWKTALAAAGLSAVEREEHRQAILTFLHYCKVRHRAARVSVIREYLEQYGQAGERGDRESARTALRWFYRMGRRGGGSPAQTGKPRAVARSPIGRRSDVPAPALYDLGGPAWERALVRAARTRGLLWRTEETYRGWAARFARFMAPRAPEAAGSGEVGAFLTWLAVEQRVSPATQKQALNALVFLMETALQRKLGDIPFRRPAPRERMPTVLSREECSRLFAQLEGTTRLMAA